MTVGMFSFISGDNLKNICLLEFEECNGLMSDSLLMKIERVRERMTSYFDGELACIPRVVQNKD